MKAYRHGVVVVALTIAAMVFGGGGFGYGGGFW
jgi:hypothetical protein